MRQQSPSTPSPVPALDGEGLLRKYVDLISTVSREMNHPLWWATYLSSKNRYHPFNALILECIADPSRLKDHPHRSWWAFSTAIAGNILDIARTALGEGARMLLVRIFQGRSLRKAREEWKNERIVLLKSFAQVHTFSGPYRDPFFGQLTDHLRGKNVPLLTVIHPDACFGLYFRNRNLIGRVYSYQAFLGISDMLGALLELLRGLFRPFPAALDVAGVDFAPMMRRLYFLDAFSSSSYHAFLLHRVFSNIAGMFRVEHMIYPYENNFWERLPVLAMRRRSPKTVITGYQHNVVTLSSANYFPGIAEPADSPLPDRILTTGAVTAELLKRYGNYGKRLITPCCALRYAYLRAQPRHTGRLERILLVAPEGVRAASCLVNYAIRRRREIGDWKIRVRFHPAFDYDDMRPLLDDHGDDEGRFSVSGNAKLADDLRQCGALLYWGSTVSLEALAMGVPVIHLSGEHTLNMDPLFNFTGLKWIVDRETPLLQVLDEIHGLNLEELNDRRKAATDYLGDYFWEASAARLDLFTAA